MKGSKAKLVLYTSKTYKDGKTPIMLRLTKDRKTKYLSTGYTCYDRDWNQTKQELKSSFQGYREANMFLKELLLKAENAILKCESEEGEYSMGSVVTRLTAGSINNPSLILFLNDEIERLEKQGKIGNSRVYKDLRRVLLKVSGSELTFNEVDHAFLSKLQTDFMSRGVKGSTISIYMRTLRALYNKAIDSGLIEKKVYPFESFRITGIKSEVEKRKALSKEELLLLINSNPKPFSTEFHAKNYFLFSVYAVGINFIDLAMLSEDNIRDGRLSYTRSKTGKVFSIKLHSAAEEILQIYKSCRSNTKFIFPILLKQHNTPKAKKERITSMNIKINKGLRRLANATGVQDTKGLTFYSARHTWATIQKKRGTKTSIISESLGHSTEKVTQAYLESFENEVLDNSNFEFISEMV